MTFFIDNLFLEVSTEGESLQIARDVPDVPVMILTAMRPVEQPRYIGETEKGLQVKFES